MTYDKFVGEVQHRARLASEGEAVRAIEATLQTLAERLDAGEARDLAAQLPRELQIYFNVEEHGVRLALEDFFLNVCSRGEVDLPKAVYHARVVIGVLQEAVSPGEIADVRAQLPPDWAPLFEAGSQGGLRDVSTASSKSNRPEDERDERMQEGDSAETLQERANRSQRSRTRTRTSAGSNRGRSVRVRAGAQRRRTNSRRRTTSAGAGNRRSNAGRDRRTTTGRRQTGGSRARRSGAMRG